MDQRFVLLFFSASDNSECYHLIDCHQVNQKRTQNWWSQAFIRIFYTICAAVKVFHIFDKLNARILTVKMGGRLLFR